MQALLRKSLIASGLVFASAVIGQNANADPGNTVHWKSIIGIIAGQQRRRHRHRCGYRRSRTVVGAGWQRQRESGQRKDRFRCPRPGACRRELDRDSRFHGAGHGNPGLRHQWERGRWQFHPRRDAVRGSRRRGRGRRFHGNVGALPAVCTSEPDIAFLIRTSSGRWIANGTVIR